MDDVPTALPLNVLADELAARGIRMAPLLERANLRPSDLAGADRRASAAAIGRLVGDAVALTGLRDLPLRIGARCSLAWAGPLGAAARHAATLGEALADLERLPELRDTVGGVSLARLGGEAHFMYHLDVADVPNAPLLYEIALAVMYSAVHELTRGAVVPWVVRVPCRRPADLTAYRKHLGPHLKFDSVTAELVVDAAALAFPLPSAEPVRRRMALALVARQIVRREPMICVSVRNAIRLGLAHGSCSRADAAAQLGLHERALGRRLQDAGTSFRTLREEERSIRARLLLRHTRVGVERISRTLGYVDSTVFGRAFRRWTGEMPCEFRRRYQCPTSGGRGAVAAPAGSVSLAQGASAQMVQH